MAEIFLARAQDPERLVVIKRLRAQLAVEPEFVQMFLAEGRLALTLRHPNVVEVFDVTEGDDGSGQFYIAMEYLHGHDLRETVAQLVERRATVRLDQALSVTRAVAAGLHYTHEHTGADGQQLGIVHRDVSPHNVLLTFDGQVKLVDFGIAKTNNPQGRTRTGVLKGKAAYMAPEQAMGLSLDRRSDVFCLGILMWEMTTGRRLFRRRTELDTLNAVAHAKPPRPSRVDARYPRDLENLVMKTLSHAPEDRWATASELIDAIDELARRRTVTLGPEPVRDLLTAAFAEELAAWRAVQAFGISLGDHLVARYDREATLPNDSDLETEDDCQQLPAPVFEMTRQERPVRNRRRWLVAAAALVIGVAAGSLVVRHGMQSNDPAARTPDIRMPSAPSAPVSPAPATSPAPTPTAAGPGAGSAAPPPVQPDDSPTTTAVGPGVGSAVPPPVHLDDSPTTTTVGPGVGSAVPPPVHPDDSPIAAPSGPSVPPGVPAGAIAAPPRAPSNRLPPVRPTVRPRSATPAASERKAVAPAPIPAPSPPPPVPEPARAKPSPPRPSPADLDKLP